MNWRRGLLLAAIHLAVAIPCVIWEEASVWQWIPDRESSPATPMIQPRDDNTVSFSPCDMTEGYSAARTIVLGADTPAVALSGWRMWCPAPWQIAGMAGGVPFQNSRAVEKKASLGLWVCLVVVWLLVGGFPLRRHARWHEEPGSFITFCTLCSVALVAVCGLVWLAVQAFTPPPHQWEFPHMTSAAAFPSLFAMLAWYWWLGLLIWRLLQGAWRLIRRVPFFRASANEVARP